LAANGDFAVTAEARLLAGLLQSRIEEPERTYMMDLRCIRRCRMAVAGGAVLIAVGVLAAGCGGGGKQTPTTTTTTTTTPTTTPTATTTMLPGGAPPSPTEKDLSPTGGNLFTPQIKAPAAPTEPPGVHRHHK
jgi:hypothetical protein